MTEDWQRSFSCKICFQPFTKRRRYPITLSCGHSFCLVCVRKLGQGRTSIQCGICRANTYSDCRKLGKNILLTELMERNKMIEDDEIREAEPDEMNNTSEEGQEETGGFVVSQNLDEFYGNLQTLEELVQVCLRGTKSRQFAKKILELHQRMQIVEHQLRSCSESYVRNSQILQQMIEYMNQVVALGGDTNVESDDFIRHLNLELFTERRSSPDRLIPIRRLEMLEGSEEEDNEAVNARSGSSSNVNHHHRRRRRIRCHQHRPTSQRLQLISLDERPQVASNGEAYESTFEDSDRDWGSSDGWGFDQ